MRKSASPQRYDTVVVIGRFQPPHAAHSALLNAAIACARRHVIIGIGSAHQPRTVKNPFTFAERAALLAGLLPAASGPQISYIPLEDKPGDNAAWVAAVRQAVAAIAAGADIALLGHDKDASSFYLKLFPDWATPGFAHHDSPHATQIRALYFQPQTPLARLSPMVSPLVLQFLARFRQTADYARLSDEKPQTGRETD